MLDEGGAIRKDRWIPVIKKESHDSNRGFLLSRRRTQNNIFPNQ
jgi:hypothetical protein